MVYGKACALINFNTLRDILIIFGQDILIIFGRDILIIFGRHVYQVKTVWCVQE